MDPAPSQLSRFPEIVDRLYNAAAQENLSPSDCLALYQDIDNEIQLLQSQPVERMRSICNDTISRFDKRGHNMQDLEKLTTWLAKHTFQDAQGNFHGAQPAFQNLLNCISKIHHSVFESEAHEKNVSYLNQDPFEGEELALLEYVGGSALELTKTNSDSVILNIGHRWLDAAKRNLNTSERMQLYADTEKVIECFNDKKTKKFVLDQFYEHPIEDWEALAKWIGKNTGVEYVTRKETTESASDVYVPLNETASDVKPKEGNDLNFTGAYHIFHQLAKCFSEKKDFSEDIFDDWNDDAMIEDIDTAALRHFENNTINISEIPEDVQKLVFSDVQQLQFMARASRNFEKFSKSTLAQYINESKFTYSDLGLQNLEQIVSYFGPHCKELTKLYFEYAISEDKSAAKKLLASFPNISHLDLYSFVNPTLFDYLDFEDLPVKFLKLNQCRELKSLNFLEKQHKLESLVIISSWVKDFKILSLCPLKHLDLEACSGLYNYEFLKELQFLETVSLRKHSDLKIDGLKFCPLLREIKLISTMGISLDFLKECKALEVLHLERISEVNDFNFLKNCSKLHTLKFYDAIPDSSFLFEIPSLRKLHVSENSLASNVIQFLQMKGIEVIIDPAS